MILKFKQKMRQPFAKRKRRKNERGVALLMSMIFAGAILSIAVGVAFLIDSDNRFAALNQESQRTVYALDAASECIRFWSQQNTSDDSQQTISCNGNERTFNTENDYDFTFSYDSPYNYSADISVTQNDGDGRRVENISVIGRNSSRDANDQTIQRFRESEYSTNFDEGGDVYIVFDVSGSVQSGELERAKTSVQQYVEAALENENTQIGLITFGSDIRVLSELTGSLSAMTDAVDNIASPDRGSTNLVDAISCANYKFTGEANSSNPKPDNDNCRTVDNQLENTTPKDVNVDDDSPNSIILITDGEPKTSYAYGNTNGRPGSPDGMTHLEYVETQAQSLENDGVTVNTILVSSELECPDYYNDGVGKQYPEIEPPNEDRVRQCASWLEYNVTNGEFVNLDSYDTQELTESLIRIGNRSFTPLRER